MLKAQNITKIFKRKHGDITALSNVSVDIQEGEFVSIIGPSGSGKSTLLLALGGMNTPSEGTVLWDNQSVYDWEVGKRARWRATQIGFVFQSFNLIPYLTVYENVSVGLSLATNDHNAGEKINALLDELKLADRKDHVPSELSVGQQQRVALARALIKKPRLILADEPTGNLDAETGAEVINIIKRQHESGKTVVLVTHDPNIAKIAERTIRIVEGRVVF